MSDNSTKQTTDQTKGNPLDLQDTKGSFFGTQTTDLLSAVKAEGLHLYVDEWARRLKWTAQEVDYAARQLRDDGLLSLHSAPHGVLLAPTLRGASMSNPDRTETTGEAD